LFVACHCVLMNGTAMRFHPRFDARRAIADFAKSTVFMGVPTFYMRLLGEAGLTPEACAGMRLFVSGSAPLLAQTHDEFSRRSGHRILERYGMTETGMLASNPLEGERRPGSVGPPLPGTQVRIVDDADKPIAPGEVGHVQVQGDNVFSGYWRMPERNQEEFADGWFRTGDMGSLSFDGYLTIVGRSKDLIITGGYNVYPKEIELALDELPGVRESAVVGVPHADFGEAVTAVVVPSLPELPPNEADILEALKHRLANFKVPKRVHVVDALPRNAMGKVQKNVLRDRYRT
jgi:malonyl-CoA/methylmalonyl-CoA synthetase